VYRRPTIRPACWRVANSRTWSPATPGCRCTTGPPASDSSVGLKRVLKDNLSKDFHDYGMWWTPDAIIIEIDGEPVATIVTHGSVTGVVSWFKFFAL
jgi:Glycosyl hydrolases family 16